MGRVGAKMALVVAGALTVTGCSTSGESGPSIGSMVLFAGSTTPPVQQAAVEDVHCPTVGIIDGGSAIQAYSGGRVGDAAALRSQITLGQLARECAGQADGSTIVKVGVEGRALIGAAGGAGRYDVPVHIVIKKGPTVLANRVQRTSVEIPAGATQGSFVVVEEGILVPASAAQEFEIEVGLGGGPAQPQQGRRRRG
jgi:hypothetical protein